MVARRKLITGEAADGSQGAAHAVARGLCYIQNVPVKKNKRISVTSAAGKYAIVCGPGVLRSAASEVFRLGKFSSVHIVSSPKVWRAVGKLLPARFDSLDRPTIHLFNDAEQAKTLESVETIARSLSRTGADRQAVLIAVGGGMVGDVAGFAAASYLRGITLVHVPTTLLAQVDSAIGGKTGVNLPEGKNLVGAFYSPRLVLSDPQTLRTLPDREFRGGIAEVIKYGVISDAKLFAFLESNMEKVFRRDAKALSYIIPRCAEIKARVVSHDEHESGLREILNFGHTFGHALESVTKYRVFQHGEAVAWGMIAAVLLGYVAGITPEKDTTRIISLVRRMGALPAWPDAGVSRLVSAMRADKKTRGGKIRFVLAPRIGLAKSCDDVSLKLLEGVLRFGPGLLGSTKLGG